MKRTVLTSVMAGVVAFGAAGVVRGQMGAPVAYPEGYREWAHVKSMVIQKDHPLFGAFGGIHHIYANARALEGYKSGTFADGAVIVFDLLEAPVANGAITEGARKVVAVMHRDGKRFASTGGWGFEGFKADTRDRVVKDAAKECFACHKADAPGDFVFSTWRP